MGKWKSDGKGQRGRRKGEIKVRTRGEMGKGWKRSRKSKKRG